MPTMRETRGIAWWFFWRYTACSLAVGLTIGSAVGFVMGSSMFAAGYSLTTIQYAAMAVGKLLGVVVSFFILNFMLSRLLGREVDGKRIILIDDSSKQS